MPEHISPEHVSEQDLLLAFDGELPADRNESVRAHARECAVCEERWASLSRLSEEVTAQLPSLTFQPQEAAVAMLQSRMKSAAAPKRAHWMSLSPSLAIANTLAAVAVAITCIVLFPSLRRASPPISHPPVVYDLEETVPAGYVSLPYADPALPLDDASILPVELSAEDLELMGLDAPEEAGDVQKDGVQAEILIGIDGWPRAIRIVQ